MPVRGENEVEQAKSRGTRPRAADFNARNFTSNKLTLLDALSMDPEVSPAEFRVAFRLLQHANAKTGAIFPSQQRISAQIDGSGRWVRKCISRLEEIGWLEFERANRQHTNHYKFCPTRIAEVMENAKARVAALWRVPDGAAADEAAGDTNDSAGTIDPLPTGTIDPLPTGAIVPLNTPKQHENRTQEHPIEGGPAVLDDVTKPHTSTESVHVKGFVEELADELLRHNEAEQMTHRQSEE